MCLCVSKISFFICLSSVFKKKQTPEPYFYIIVFPVLPSFSTLSSSLLSLCAFAVVYCSSVPCSPPGSKAVPKLIHLAGPANYLLQPVWGIGAATEWYDLDWLFPFGTCLESMSLWCPGAAPQHEMDGASLTVVLIYTNEGCNSNLKRRWGWNMNYGAMFHFVTGTLHVCFRCGRKKEGISRFRFLLWKLGEMCSD